MCLVPSVALVLGSCLARTPRCEGSLSGVDPEGSTTSYVSRQSDTTNKEFSRRSPTRKLGWTDAGAGCSRLWNFQAG
jgi:hypothetical protein